MHAYDDRAVEYSDSEIGTTIEVQMNPKIYLTDCISMG